MDEKGLGRQLQAMRIQAGLTQQALCQQAGLSYSTLTKIERGAIKAPSIFTIQNIATALGVGLDHIMKNTSTPSLSVAKKQRSKSGISFVYFDINGCLVRFYHRAFTRLAEVSGASTDVIETAFWHYNDEVCRGEMTMDEFNEAFAKDLGLESVNWPEYYLETVEPIEEMQTLIRWAAQHYRIGLLTNTMPGLVELMLQRGLLPSVAYEVIIDSSKVGAIKPEAKIYDIAARKAECPSGEILLIDDARVNLMAAEKQGWRVLWFDDYRPDESIARIRSALELAD
ncbi:MAG TPA: helix-turn-helix domain-containing protein [Candidatus Saccharimonadales bacterium]